jgi:hypothetical protein
VQLGNGCAVSDRFMIVVGFPDTTPPQERYSRLFYFNLDLPERWNHRDVPNQTIMSVCLRKPAPRVLRAGCAVSDEGYVEIVNSNEEIIEKIPGAGLRDLEQGMPMIGYLKDINEVGSTFFACGSFGQIYRRDLKGWTAIDGGLVEQSRTIEERINHRQATTGDYGYLRKNVEDAKAQAQLDEIGGSSESDVYTCGMYGHLYHFNGKEWRKLNSGTSEHLLGMHCVSEDEVIISGYAQTLLKGNAQKGFQLLHQANTDMKFWSVRKFQNQIHVATAQGLRRFNGSDFDVIRNLQIGFDETTVIQQIDNVSDNYLWIVGDRHVFRYDGEIVEKFQHPDNT